jgi:hypothetical protein
MLSSCFDLSTLFLNPLSWSNSVRIRLTGIKFIVPFGNFIFCRHSGQSTSLTILVLKYKLQECKKNHDKIHQFVHYTAGDAYIFAVEAENF